DEKTAEITTKWIDKIGTSQPDAVVAAAAPGGDAPGLTDKQLLNGLIANIPAMSKLLDQMAAARNTLPPSPAMAGIYTTMDRERGVWNAPANVGIAQLVGPVVDINAKDQEDLNV